MRTVDHILNNERDVLSYLKTRFPLFHESNIFFRDVQYGIQSMLREQGIRVSYTEAERLARDILERLERTSVLIRLDRQTWRVNDMEYKTPQVKKPAAAGKAAAPAASSAAPAQALPRPAGSAAVASAERPG
jgi:hypothetical protein